MWLNFQQVIQRCVCSYPLLPVSGLTHYINVCMCSHHEDGLGVDGLGHHVTVVCDVLDHLIESGSLHLFVLQVAEWIADKVKQHAALTELLDKQLLTLHEGGILGGGEGRGGGGG